MADLKHTLAAIQEDLDDMKTAITDNQYNEMCKKLKTAYDMVPPPASVAAYRLTFANKEGSTHYECMYLDTEEVKALQKVVSDADDTFLDTLFHENTCDAFHEANSSLSFSTKNHLRMISECLDMWYLWAIYKVV